MALTTWAQVLAAMPGQAKQYGKSALGGVTAAWYSPWLIAGYPPAGSAPSSGLAGDVPTKATTGAFDLVNAGGSNTLYLARFHGALVGSASGAAGTIYLYDRLWHNSGIDATITTAQTVNSTALTRPDANGDQAQLWWQVYAVMGAGTPNVTVTYTNQDGTGSRSTGALAFATTLAAGRTGPFNLASGDTGVRSVQTWQADATFTSGTIGLVIRRLIGLFPARAYRSDIADALDCNLARVDANACLELVYMVSTTTALSPMGHLEIVEG